MPAISGAVTIVCTFTPRRGVTGDSGTSITLNENASNFHELYYNTGGSLAYVTTVAGAVQANAGLGVVPVSGTQYKIAYTANTNDFRASLNGGAVFSDVSGTVPSNLASIRIGGPGLTAGNAAIDVARWAIYPRSVNSSQLVKL